jgi:hypothetical protein
VTGEIAVRCVRDAEKALNTLLRIVEGI